MLYVRLRRRAACMYIYCADVHRVLRWWSRRQYYGRSGKTAYRATNTVHHSRHVTGAWFLAPTQSDSPWSQGGKRSAHHGWTGQTRSENRIISCIRVYNIHAFCAREKELLDDGVLFISSLAKNHQYDFCKWWSSIIWQKSNNTYMYAWFAVLQLTLVSRRRTRKRDSDAIHSSAHPTGSFARSFARSLVRSLKNVQCHYFLPVSNFDPILCAHSVTWLRLTGWRQRWFCARRWKTTHTTRKQTFGHWA